jgi:hypothetical protein
VSSSFFFAIQALTTDRRDAPVPAPKIDKFTTTVSSKKAKNRLLEKQEKDAATAAQKSADNWLRFAPTFRIPHLKLSQLMRRPKNSPPDVAAADAAILKMQDIRPDACSARLVDSDHGDTLVCIFSHRLLPAGEIAPEKKTNSEAQSEVIFSFPLRRSC